MYRFTIDKNCATFIVFLMIKSNNTKFIIICRQGCASHFKVFMRFYLKRSNVIVFQFDCGRFAVLFVSAQL
jgi:hypothetical protein